MKPHHLSSLAWMDHTLASGDGILVPGLFLAEIGGSIVRRTRDADEATRNIGLVRTGAMFTVVDTDPLIDLIIDTAITASLRGADAVYVALRPPAPGPARHLGPGDRAQGRPSDRCPGASTPRYDVVTPIRVAQTAYSAATDGDVRSTST